jgi:hypothetical protein
MKREETINTRHCTLAKVLALVAVLLLTATSLAADDSSAGVQLDTRKTGPRAVESQTERAIVRDYGFAWASMAKALEFNTIDPLQGPFVGTARERLTNTVASQRSTGLSSHYSGQSHKVQAVFYAPEGDVIELHDTAEFQLQIMDGGKVVHEEHAVRHYVVLMTPGADRWSVRQLQAVPQF